MASAATAALGTILTIDGTAVAELKNIEPAGINTDRLDVTNHQSVGGFREYISGLSDGGECKMSGNYLPTDAAQSALVTANLNRTINAYTVQFPDAGTTTWSFNGLVSGFSPKAPVEGILSFDATVKVTGLPTIA